MGLKHLNIKVTGKVQGVFFRASTMEKAKQLGIKGFVRNEPDKSVYIEAEGEDGQLQTFLNWCHEGPKMAMVEHVSSSEGPVANYSAFEISRNN